MRPEVYEAEATRSRPRPRASAMRPRPNATRQRPRPEWINNKCAY